VKTEKSGKVACGEGERGDDQAALLVKNGVCIFFPMKNKKRSCLRAKCQETWVAAGADLQARRQGVRWVSTPPPQISKM